MKLKTKISWLFFSTLLVALISFSYFTHRQSNLYKNQIFSTITGGKIALKDLQGSPVLITFWATSCRLCIKEIPELIQLHNRYAPLGLKMVAIAMPYDPPNRVVRMTKQLQLPYEIALDIQGLHTKAFGDISLTPTTLLLNTEGQIDLNIVGTINFDQLEEKIKAELNKG